MVFNFYKMKKMLLHNNALINITVHLLIHYYVLCKYLNGQSLHHCAFTGISGIVIRGVTNVSPIRLTDTGRTCNSLRACHHRPLSVHSPATMVVVKLNSRQPNNLYDGVFRRWHPINRSHHYSRPATRDCTNTCCWSPDRYTTSLSASVRSRPKRVTCKTSARFCCDRNSRLPATSVTSSWSKWARDGDSTCDY